MLETGAANPSARTLQTSDEEIGEMMRMVIAHEVGHALGFPHNMAGSFAYPVDSYRNGEFTQEFGIAASIMDYARYNYIAQPGDKNIRFIRQMGPMITMQRIGDTELFLTLNHQRKSLKPLTNGLLKRQMTLNIVLGDFKV